jgi:hypothetical protein
MVQGIRLADKTFDLVLYLQIFASIWCFVELSLGSLSDRERVNFGVLVF